MRIDAEGLHIFPRIESLTGPATAGLSQERCPIGLTELDAMLGGGLPRESVTVLAGAPCTGKTLFALQYLLEGARRGEKGLFIGCREAPQLLIDKVRGFGMDLQTPVEQGIVQILHRLPVDLLVDELLNEMMRRIETFRPRRLVMDSLVEIEHAVADEWRQRSVLVCLAELLRTRAVTTLVNREASQIAGPELSFSDSPLATLGGNLMLMRYVEFRGELHRILSILSMRDTAHDRTIRQYEITGAGLRVLKDLESAEGLLSGIARLPSEMRVKRPPSRTVGEA